MSNKEINEKNCAHYQGYLDAVNLSGVGAQTLNVDAPETNIKLNPTSPKNKKKRGPSRGRSAR